MQTQFEILKITRGNYLKAIEGLSDEQLLIIPKGFNNNILWNVGHILSSGQKLTYGLAGLPLGLPEVIPTAFAKGTDPKSWNGAPIDVKVVKELLVELPVKLEEDYKKGIFKSFKDYPTSYGFLIKNIEDSITFSNTHEALHLGVVKSLRKLV